MKTLLILLSLTFPATIFAQDLSERVSALEEGLKSANSKLSEITTVIDELKPLGEKIANADIDGLITQGSQFYHASQNCDEIKPLTYMKIVGGYNSKTKDYKREKTLFTANAGQMFSKLKEVKCESESFWIIQLVEKNHLIDKFYAVRAKDVVGLK